MSDYKILTINPGSTSTKIAIYEGSKKLFSENVSHDASELAKYAGISDQMPYREETIRALLDKNGVSLKDVAAVVGRGGGPRRRPTGHGGRRVRHERRAVGPRRPGRQRRPASRPAGPSAGQEIRR